MKLFLVTRKEEIGYDTYDSFVVLAKDEDEARNTHPKGEPIKWDNKEDYYDYSWTYNKANIEVKEIGLPHPAFVESSGNKLTIVCSSFNAG